MDTTYTLKLFYDVGWVNPYVNLIMWQDCRPVNNLTAYFEDISIIVFTVS